ncbi:nuclear transport factor 2 family protein [Gordonia sp. NPDC003376]
MIEIRTPARTAHALYDALAAGDADGIRGLLTPGFVGITAAGLPLGLGGTYHGPDAMMGKFWWPLGKVFAVRAHAGHIDTLADDRLLVTGTYRGTCRGTGRRVDAAFTHTLSFDGDRISELHQLTDTAVWHAALDGAERATAPVHPGPDVTQLETIDYSVTDGVAQVLLDRPAHRNAIDLTLAEESLAVARAIAADPAVRAVFIGGNGPDLTVGGDIDEFVTAAPEHSAPSPSA